MHDLFQYSKGSEVVDWHQLGGMVQFVTNPLFEEDTTLAYNLLFQIDVDHSLEPGPKMSIDCRIWDPSSASRFQTGLA